MKRLVFVLIAVIIVISLAACGTEDGQPLFPTEQPSTGAPAVKQGAVTILFTGGLNGNHSDGQPQGSASYAALKAYADQLKADKHTVLLIDGGDSLASDSADELWDVVDACDYDFRVPGALELSCGVQQLLDRTKNTNNLYLSCNLMDVERNEPLFDPYVLVEVGNAQIGFVGVTQPGSLIESDLQRYELVGRQGGQELRDVIQSAIDQAANAGADYVIVVGNLGTSLDDSPWTTVEVISGITGMSAWLDCGSGAVLNGETVTDKDEHEIPVCSPGSDFAYIGQLAMNMESGAVETRLLTAFDKTDRTIWKLIEKMELDE